MNEVVPAGSSLPIFTNLAQSSQAVEFRDSANVLVSKGGQFATPTDDASAAVITEFLAQCKALKSLLEGKRKEMKAPILAKTKELEESFKGEDGPMTRLDQLITDTQMILTPYLLEKQRLQQEQEKRIRDQAAAEEREREEARRKEQQALADAQSASDDEERRKAEAEVEAARQDLDDLSSRTQTRVAAPATAAKTSGSAGATAQLRDNWKYRLTDINLVPENYLVEPEDRINRGKLAKMAKKMGADATVPGIEFYNEPGITSRTA